jgi:CMP-N-acetylneuraminic acid synthetase
MLENKSKFLAIIPARGGSKGVPRKNIRVLGGQPLIAYSIKIAKDCSFIDYVVVSTDDNEIKAIAESYGADVVVRPNIYSADDSRTEDALIHSLDFLEDKGMFFDYVLVLEPTTPFRKKSTIKNACAKIESKKWQSILSVCETSKVFGEISQDTFLPAFPDAPRRRQERTPLYEECGVIYACSVDYLREYKTLASKSWGAVIVDKLEALDINDEIDFMMVEGALRKFKGSENE